MVSLVEKACQFLSASALDQYVLNLFDLEMLTSNPKKTLNAWAQADLLAGFMTTDKEVIESENSIKRQRGVQVDLSQSQSSLPTLPASLPKFTLNIKSLPPTFSSSRQSSLEPNVPYIQTESQYFVDGNISVSSREELYDVFPENSSKCVAEEVRPLGVRPLDGPTDLAVEPRESVPAIPPLLLSSNSKKGAAKKARKCCKFDGCDLECSPKSPYCIEHTGSRRCQYDGCQKCAQGSTKFCIAHGGGRRCTFPNCFKGARDKFFCAGHGGGKRCVVDGCSKSAVGGSKHCTAHGGGKRCQEPGCDKSSQSSTMYCVRHGGGRQCSVSGCIKVARGRTEFCAAHGGGARCKVSGCIKAAVTRYKLCRGHHHQYTLAVAMNNGCLDDDVWAVSGGVSADSGLQFGGEADDDIEDEDFYEDDENESIGYTSNGSSTQIVKL